MTEIPDVPVDVMDRDSSGLSVDSGLQDGLLADIQTIEGISISGLHTLHQKSSHATEGIENLSPIHKPRFGKLHEKGSLNRRHSCRIALLPIRKTGIFQGKKLHQRHKAAILSFNQAKLHLIIRSGIDKFSSGSLLKSCGEHFHPGTLFLRSQRALKLCPEIKGSTAAVKTL